MAGRLSLLHLFSLASIFGPKPDSAEVPPLQLLCTVPSEQQRGSRVTVMARASLPISTYQLSPALASRPIITFNVVASFTRLQNLLHVQFLRPDSRSITNNVPDGSCDRSLFHEHHQASLSTNVQYIPASQVCTTCSHSPANCQFRLGPYQIFPLRKKKSHPYLLEPLVCTGLGCH